MKLIDLRRRLRRFDLLDLFFIKLGCIIIGIIIASYYYPFVGFVRQNFIIVLFILVAIVLRPVIRYFRD